jgi:hypothetical protein
METELLRFPGSKIDPGRPAVLRLLPRYVRALRLGFCNSDPEFARLVRYRGTVTSLGCILWSIEAHLALGDAVRLYAPPLNEVCNTQFVALGLKGGQWPMVHESAKVFEAGSAGHRQAAVTATSNPEAAATTKSNWAYANPVSGFTSFELDAQLEYLSWCVTAQLYPAPGGRTSRWLDEFESLLELTRARAFVLCVLPQAVEVVDETHKFKDLGRKGGWGTMSSTTATTASVKSKPKKTRLTVKDFTGGSDDEEELPPPPPSREEDEEDEGGGLFSKRGAKRVEKEEETETARVDSAYVLCVAAYLDAIDTEVVLSRCLDVSEGPQGPQAKEALRKARCQFLEKISELDTVETLQKFRAFIARSAVLPACDRRIYDVRTNQRDPSWGEMATTKNANMVSIDERDVIAAACAHARLFGDFSLDFVLRNEFGTGSGDNKKYPTDCVSAGFFTEGGTAGWSWKGTSFTDEIEEVECGEGEDDERTEAWEGPTLFDLVEKRPRRRPYILRCALLDVFCVHSGGGAPANVTKTFTSVLAALLYMKSQSLLPQALAEFL